MHPIEQRKIVVIYLTAIVDDRGGGRSSTHLAAGKQEMAMIGSLESIAHQLYFSGFAIERGWVMPGAILGIREA